MADEIIQTFGLNAQQCIDEMMRLDKSFQTFESRLKSSADAIQKFNSAKIDSATNSLKSFTDSTKNVERLTVSFEYLTSRILYTQTVVSMFGNFRRELNASVVSAEEFQRKIAEITTISDLSQSGAGGLVRNLSDQFNVPLLEESAALYQTLSNGIVDSAKATQFLAEANRFARATNSTTANSVDLLSGAIKSFGMSTEDTSRAAGILFEAIRAGRITAGELGGTFGRVGPRAAELGLSLEETAGALAAITIKGVKTSEAITQLGGILTALTKPTDTMSAALNKMGFSTSEEAIAALKLPGVLQAISDSTNGTSAALAKMFPNVRGIAGELALTGDGMKEFIANVKSMESISSNLSTSKYLQATATDAEKVTKEINKLKNAFVVGFGESVLKAGANIAALSGGANTLIPVMSTLTPLMEAGAIAVGVWGIRALATNEKLRTMAGGVGLLSKSFLAVGAAMSVGEGLGNLVNKWSESSSAALRATNDEAIASMKAAQSEQLRIAESLDKARVQSALKATAELNKAYQADVANIKTADSTMVAVVSSSIDNLVQAREKAVSQLKQTVDGTEKVIEASQSRISNLLVSKSDRAFSSKISGFDDPTKSAMMAERALQLANQAAAAMSKATTPHGIEDAIKEWAKAKQEAEQALSTAGGNRGAQNQAAKALETITDNQIVAEKKLQKTTTERKPQLETQLATQQQLLAVLKEQAKVAKENLSLFEKGTPLNSGQLADRATKLKESLSTMPIQLRLEADESIKRIQNQLKEAFQGYKAALPVNISELEKLSGEKIDTGFGVTSGMTDVAKQAADLRKAFDDLDQADARVRQLRQEIQESTSEVDGFWRHLAGIPSSIHTKIDQIAASFNKLGKGKINDSDLTDLLKKISDLNRWNEKGLIHNPAAALDVESFTRALQAAKEIQDLQKQQSTSPANVPGANEKLQELERYLNGLPAGAANAERMKTSLLGVPDFSSLASNLMQAAAAMSSVAMAASSIPNMSATYAESYASRGGRGTDTVPAMLTPGEMVVNAGEMVVNAGASKRWFSQLQAMNAGMSPVYRSEGGTTITNTVGDVFVQGGKTGVETARNIMTGIRRELRRGSGSL